MRFATIECCFRGWAVTSPPSEVWTTAVVQEDHLVPVPRADETKHEHWCRIALDISVDEMESALCSSEEPFGVVGLATDGVQLLREGGWSHSSRSSSSSSSSLNAGRDIGIECGSSSDSDSLSDSDTSDNSGYSSGLPADAGAERANKKHAGGTSCEEASLARPAHPAALHALYWTFVFNCFSEQSWRFAGAALLALLHQSILPVAVARFASQLVACVAAPLVGDLLDSAPRVPALRAILVAQSGAIMVGAAATMHALNFAFPAQPPPAASDTAATSTATSALSALPAAAVLQQGWFVVLLVAGAVERVMGLATGVAVEIDWVLVLVGEGRPELMATAMATLGRIEQFGEVAGAFTFGGLIATYGPFVCVKACMALAALSIPALLALTALTNHLSHGALSHSGPCESAQRLVPAVDSAAEDTTAAALPHVLDAAPCILSRVGMAVIGAFSSACAAMGFVACFISPALVARLGILQAGSIALLFQATMLALAVLDFSSLSLCPPFLHQRLLMLFLLLVGVCVPLSFCSPLLPALLHHPSRPPMWLTAGQVLSRMGQGMYQIVGCQIIQAVPAASANLFGTTEMALGSLAELAMLSLAILFHDPKYFGALMLVSFAAVLAAAALYCHWLARPDPRLAKLFPDQPKSWWGNLFWGGTGQDEGEREEEALLREQGLGLGDHRRREAGDEEVGLLRDRQV
ncbi:unnamed protein product [Closterium sp. Yama58-4]|nr:unnamed protein product [Closterium sp. Yama58-4]